MGRSDQQAVRDDLEQRPHHVGTADSYAGAVFGPMLLNGLSAGLAFMPVTATALSDVEPEHAGAAPGLLRTTRPSAYTPSDLRKLQMCSSPEHCYGCDW